MLRYLISVGDAFSQLVGTVLTYSATPNESISGAAYRRDDWLRPVLDGLFRVFHEEHCRKSHEADVARALEAVLDAGYVVHKGHTYQPVSQPTEATMTRQTVPGDVQARVAEAAAYYEMNWHEFAKDIETDDQRNDWKRAVEQADWPAIVASYPMELLRKVERDGTVFGFTRETRKAIRDAVVGEISKRQADDEAPKGQGMGGDGSQH
jgi:hypothetical protein